MSIPGISVGPNFPNNYPRPGQVNGADDDYNNFVSDVSSEYGSDNKKAADEYKNEGQDNLHNYLDGLEGSQPSETSFNAEEAGFKPHDGAGTIDDKIECVDSGSDDCSEALSNVDKLGEAMNELITQKMEELSKIYNPNEFDIKVFVDPLGTRTWEVKPKIIEVNLSGINEQLSIEQKRGIFDSVINNENVSLKDKLADLFGRSEINFSNALTQEQIQALYNLVMEDTSMTPAEKFELLGKSGIDFSKVDPKFNELIEKYERASRRNSNNGSGGGGGTPAAQAANDGLGTFGGLTINSGSSIAQSYIFGTGHGGGGYDVVVQVGDAEHRYHEDGTNKS